MFQENDKSGLQSIADMLWEGFCDFQAVFSRCICEETNEAAACHKESVKSEAIETVQDVDKCDANTQYEH